MNDNNSYRQEVLESDRLQQEAIKEAARKDELNQQRLEQINREAKARLTDLYRKYHKQ